MAKKNCVVCKINPILVRKWQLCNSCYQKMRYKELVERTPINKLKYLSDNEAAFASQYLNSGWVYEPACFRLPRWPTSSSRTRTATYTPDFWDPSRQAFIELCASRPNYEANRAKYAALRRQYPSIPFVVVRMDNTEIPPDGHF